MTDHEQLQQAKAIARALSVDVPLVKRPARKPVKRYRRSTLREVLGDCPEALAMHIVSPNRLLRYPAS